MAQKLYRAEVTFHFYFLAEEGKEQHTAEYYMDDAINDDGSISPYVEEVTEMVDMLEWDDHDSLVYGDHEDDITLKKAFEISTGKSYEQEEKDFKKRFEKP